MSHRSTRFILIGLEILVAVMGIYGGVALLADAAKFGVKEEWLHGSPFTNYQIPAIGLLVGVCGSSLLAAGALLQDHMSLGARLSMAAGAILMAFEIAETYSFGLRNVQQPLMFIMGLIIAGLGVILWNAGRMRAVPRARSVHAH